ncbi:MAG: hypothetical protein IJW82_05345 [Clostridia bacterium]|nr:hypothetical protein [Clostridia bacterium]
MDLNLKIREIVKLKRTSNLKYEKEITDLFLIDYNETINFLNSATNIEIACVIDALNNLVKQLNMVQARKIIEIFKQKRIQFPNIQLFTSTDYDKEIKSAEEYIK